MISVLSRLKNFLIRRKENVVEAIVFVVLTAAATIFAYKVDIFANPDRATIRENTIEWDEALVLGAAIALVMFAMRRYLIQRRETAKRIEAERAARALAFEDTLTGLPNRRQFDDALKAAIDAPAGGEAAHAVFLIDLNGFKQINDVYGHGVGDRVLVAVGQRLKAAVRERDLVARFGGDEFAVLARHLAGPEAATNIALRIIQSLETPIEIDHRVYNVGAGVGIALLPPTHAVAEETMRQADVALYRAKAEKRSALRFFEEEMDQHVRDRARIEGDLRMAMQRGEINPVYKPVYDLRSQQILGFEAAPQWIHPDDGEIEPSRFLAIAEECGLIHELASRLFFAACSTAAQWPEPVWLSVDIFPLQLKDRDLPVRMMDTLRKTGLDAARLQVELTESALVADLDAARAVIEALHDCGVKVALDHFGAGYSSLYHLRNIKVDKIKIDRSFIGTIASEKESAAIVSALVGLGHGLGLTIAADGIEDLRQGVSLLETGCEQGQGDLYGKSLTASRTQALFQDAADLYQANA